MIRADKVGFRGEFFFLGIAASNVASIVVSDGRGHTRDVELTSRAFAFQGKNAAIVGAYDADGTLLDR